MSMLLKCCVHLFKIESLSVGSELPCALSSGVYTCKTHNKAGSHKLADSHYSADPTNRPPDLTPSHKKADSTDVKSK